MNEEEYYNRLYDENLAMKLSQEVANRKFEMIATSAVSLNDFDLTHYEWRNHETRTESEDNTSMRIDVCCELFYKGVPVEQAIEQKTATDERSEPV